MLGTMKSTAFALGSTLLLLWSCSAPGDAARTSPDPAMSPTAPVVAKLRFRNVDLVISGAQGGPRFSVVERGRLPLATGLEEAEFRSHHPDLYEVYRFGLARSPYLDARLDQPRIERSSADHF